MCVSVDGGIFMNIAIIGGGASGSVAALRIKQNNPLINVTIYEKNAKLLKKVSVTGNGRCNFLNDNFSKEHFHSILENNIGSISSSVCSTIKEIVSNSSFSLQNIDEQTQKIYQPIKMSKEGLKHQDTINHSLEQIYLLLNQNLFH